MTSSLLRLVLPFLFSGNVIACSAAAGFCEQEDDDVKSTDVLSLLQTQTQLTAHGQSDQAGDHELPKSLPGYASTCLATSLFSVLTVMTFGGYAVSATSPSLQASIWIVFNKVVAVFSAALIVACFRDITTHFGPSVSSAHAPAPDAFLRLAAVFLAWKVMVYFTEDEETPPAASMLGSFAVAFAAIDAFNAVLMLDGTEYASINFAQSPGSAAVGTFCILVLMLVIMYFLTLLRSKVEVSDTYGALQHGMWLLRSEEAEDDIFAVAAGFLICQVASFALTDNLYPVDEMFVSGEATVADLRLAFGVVTLVFACWLAIACRIWTYKRSQQSIGAHPAHRFEYLIVRTVSTSLAWCVLRWSHLVFKSAQGRWFEQGHVNHTLMLARLLSALLLSVGTIVYVLTLTFIMEEKKESGAPDFRMVSSSIGLLIGQSWVGCFYRVSEGGSVESVLQIILSISLLCLVIPVWKVYLLPQAIKKENRQPTASMDAARPRFYRRL